MSNSKFSQWCILELFGHVRLAGLVSEQTIAGEGFLRVDIPDSENQPAFSKLYGAKAVYCITPTTEETARAVAKNCFAKPLDEFDVRSIVKQIPNLGGDHGTDD